MKFKFPLQKVLEHRKIIENLAQKEFQEAIMFLTQQQEKLQDMAGTLSRTHAQADQFIHQGGSQGANLSQIFEFQKGQAVLIQKQQLHVQQAEKLVEDKREILRQAALDYKIMEKMRENKFEEYRQKRLAEDQKQMDEQAILRFKPKEF